MYNQLNAINSASISSILGAIEYILTGWKEKNLFQKIIKATFLWVIIIEFIIGLLLFILALFGKIINLFPLINFIYCAGIYIVFIFGICIGMIASIYSPKEYLLHTNLRFREGLNEAINYM